MANRVLVMRHAHRYSDTYSIGDDPQLTPQGHEQAQQVAELLRSRDLPLVAIFRCAGAPARPQQRTQLSYPWKCGARKSRALSSSWTRRLTHAVLVLLLSSPWLRSIQTVAPLAAAMGLQIQVDRCFGEYLKAEGGHFAEDPLPYLAYNTRAEKAGLPHVPAAVLAPDGGSPFPPFPETRASTLLRHKQALERVFARIAKDYADEEGTVLVVGHGASNDFILYALCGEEAHPTGRYASDEVEPLPPPPHCCLTTIVKNGQGVWEVESYGQPTVSTSHANSAATTPKL